MAEEIEMESGAGQASGEHDLFSRALSDYRAMQHMSLPHAYLALPLSLSHPIV